MGLKHNNDLLVLKLPNSESGQSVQAWSWSSPSPRSLEGELTLMQTSSSSNESRNNDSSQKFSKVVASYSSCALAQKPIFPGDRKSKKNKENNQKSEKTMI